MSDYDQTLTKERFNDGKKADSSFKAIHDSSLVTKDDKVEAQKLYDHYFPIYKNYDIPQAEKIEHMIKWWEQNLQMYVDKKFKKTDFLQIVLESRLLFREGIREFMSLTTQLDMPLYIVSGGIADIIEASLCTVLTKQDSDAQKCFQSMGIFSNEFEYSNGKIAEYKRPLMHILNKQDFIYRHQSQFRKNVILLGDILEDVVMTRDQFHDTVVKVGFFNLKDQFPEQMDAYLKQYDVVIEGDGNLHPVIYLLHHLFKDQSNYKNDLKAQITKDLDYGSKFDLLNEALKF